MYISLIISPIPLLEKSSLLAKGKEREQVWASWQAIPRRSGSFSAIGYGWQGSSSCKPHQHQALSYLQTSDHFIGKKKLIVMFIITWLPWSIVRLDMFSCLLSICITFCELSSSQLCQFFYWGVWFLFYVIFNSVTQILASAPNNASWIHQVVFYGNVFSLLKT